MAEPAVTVADVVGRILYWPERVVAAVILEAALTAAVLYAAGRRLWPR